MKSILKPCGVEKNLKYILSNNVVMAHNIDGVHGKKSLKELENVYSALIGNIIFIFNIMTNFIYRLFTDHFLESIPINAKFPGPAEDQLRAIQLQKKREIKANSVSKKQHFKTNN